MERGHKRRGSGSLMERDARGTNIRWIAGRQEELRENESDPEEPHGAFQPADSRTFRNDQQPAVIVRPAGSITPDTWPLTDTSSVGTNERKSLCGHLLKL